MALNLTQLIKDKSIILLDGAMGSTLLAHGLTIEQSCERWNLEKAELIKSIHQSYIEAGSDIILTNTFGGNPIRLHEDNLDHQTPEINYRAVQLAKDAAQGKAYVLGDIGPTGIPIEPVGPLTIPKAMKQYMQQAQALIEAGVDGIFIETMVYLNETLAAIEAVQEYGPIPTLVSLTFHKQDDVYQTMDGITLTECIKTLQNMDVDAIGINCLSEIKDYSSILKIMSSQTDLPLIAQPNAGLPKFDGQKASYPENANFLMEDIPQIVDSGARIIGGCCGTTQEFIKKMRRWIQDNYS